MKAVDAALGNFAQLRVPVVCHLPVLDSSHPEADALPEDAGALQHRILGQVHSSGTSLQAAQRASVGSSEALSNSDRYDPLNRVDDITESGTSVGTSLDQLLLPMTAAIRIALADSRH